MCLDLTILCFKKFVQIQIGQFILFSVLIAMSNQQSFGQGVVEIPAADLYLRLAEEYHADGPTFLGKFDALFQTETEDHAKRFTEFVLSRLIDDSSGSENIGYRQADFLISALSEEYWSGIWNIHASQEEFFIDKIYELYLSESNQRDRAALDNILARSPGLFFSAQAIKLSPGDLDSYELKLLLLIEMAKFTDSRFALAAAIEYSDVLVERWVNENEGVESLFESEAILCSIMADRSCFCENGDVENCPAPQPGWLAPTRYFISSQNLETFNSDLRRRAREGWRLANDIVFRLYLLRTMQNQFVRNVYPEAAVIYLESWDPVEENGQLQGFESAPTDGNFIDGVFMGNMWDGFVYEGLSEYVNTTSLGDQLRELGEPEIEAASNGEMVAELGRIISAFDFLSWTVFAQSFLREDEAQAALSAIYSCFLEEIGGSDDQWSSFDPRVTTPNSSGYIGVAFGQFDLTDSERELIESFLLTCGYDSFWSTRGVIH